MKHFLENTFLLLIIVIGGAGIFLSFSGNPIEEKNNAFTKTLDEVYQDNSEQLAIDWTSFLHISGIPEVGSNMYFEIQSYNSNAIYTLDLGNGVKKHFKGKKQRYRYKKAGQFDLKLFITYNGKTKLVHNEKMDIDRQVVASRSDSSIN